MPDPAGRAIFDQPPDVDNNYSTTCKSCDSLGVIHLFILILLAIACNGLRLYVIPECHVAFLFLSFDLILFYLQRCSHSPSIMALEYRIPHSTFVQYIHSFILPLLVFSSYSTQWNNHCTRDKHQTDYILPKTFHLLTR